MVLSLSDFLSEFSNLISHSDHFSAVRNSHASSWGAAVDVEVLWCSLVLPCRIHVSDLDQFVKTRASIDAVEILPANLSLRLPVPAVCAPHQASFYEALNDLAWRFQRQGQCQPLPKASNLVAAALRLTFVRVSVVSQMDAA